MDHANNINLQMNKSKTFVHVVNDAIVHSELQPHIEYSNVLKKISEIAARNVCLGGYVYMSNMHAIKISNMDQLDQLKVLADLNYKYAVLWFDGCWPDDDFEDTLEETIDSWEHSWLAAGNICMDTDYPSWEHNCIVINLDSVKQVEKTNDVKNYDGYEYIPVDNEHTIQPSADYKEYDVDTNYFNWLIPTSFKNNYIVYKLPPKEQLAYNYCNPITDIEHTKSWLLTDRSIDNADEYDKICSEVKRDKFDLLMFKQQKYQVLYVTNTEELVEDVPKNLTTLIVPCSGINQWLFAQDSYETLERIIWFDVNPAQLDWMKLVVNEWDGHRFDKFVTERVGEVLNKYSNGLEDYSLIFDMDMFDNAIEYLGGEEEFQKLFNIIKSAEHVFVEMDLTKDIDLSKYISSSDVVLLNGTNIWTYESNWCTTDTLAPVTGWLGMIEQLKDNSKKAYYKGDTCFHNMLDCVNVEKIMGNR